MRCCYLKVSLTSFLQIIVIEGQNQIAIIIKMSFSIDDVSMYWQLNIISQQSNVSMATFEHCLILISHLFKMFFSVFKAIRFLVSHNKCKYCQGLVYLKTHGFNKAMSQKPVKLPGSFVVCKEVIYVSVNKKHKLCYTL